MQPSPLATSNATRRGRPEVRLLALSSGNTVACRDLHYRGIGIGVLLYMRSFFCPFVISIFEYFDSVLPRNGDEANGDGSDGGGRMD